MMRALATVGSGEGSGAVHDDHTSLSTAVGGTGGYTPPSAASGRMGKLAVAVLLALIGVAMIVIQIPMLQLVRVNGVVWVWASLTDVPFIGVLFAASGALAASEWLVWHPRLHIYRAAVVAVAVAVVSSASRIPVWIALSGQRPDLLMWSASIATTGATLLVGVLL